MHLSITTDHTINNQSDNKSNGNKFHSLRATTLMLYPPFWKFRLRMLEKGVSWLVETSFPVGQPGPRLVKWQVMLCSLRQVFSFQPCAIHFLLASFLINDKQTKRVVITVPDQCVCVMAREAVEGGRSQWCRKTHSMVAALGTRCCLHMVPSQNWGASFKIWRTVGQLGRILRRMYKHTCDNKLDTHK